LTQQPVRSRHANRWRLTAALAASAVLAPAVAAASPSAAGSAPVHAAVSAAPPVSVNTEFVTRDGTELRLDGERFRASGANIYWLGLDENVGGVNFPTYVRIKDSLDTAQQLGVNVVRSHMATSTGQGGENPLALMPELGVYNAAAFETIDYAVAYAGSLGIRLILPLTDEWSYYHGGHRDFTTPLGLESADFYTDPAAVAAYQEYVDLVLNHVNPHTGLRLADDPTVLAWELGNELEGMTLGWIDEQVAFIRERAPEQLVAAGRRFDIDPDTLQSQDLDIVDVHYYPPTAEKVRADAATVAAAGKVYIAGEYASTAATDTVLQPAAQDPNVSGMFFWSLFGNDDRGGLVPHDDGFTLHYPGTTDRMRASVAAIQRYSTALGLPVDTLDVLAPLVTAVEQTNGINRVFWRGSAGAVGYRVQRSTDGLAWTDVSGVVAPGTAQVTDLSSPVGAVYRVLAVAPDGSTAASDAVASAPLGAVLVDPLADWSLTAAHDGASIVVPSGARATAAASAQWDVTGVDSASFLLSAADGVSVSASSDGMAWTDLTTTTAVVPGGVSVTADGIGADHVRVSWPAGAVLDRATISSRSTDAETGAPSPVELVAPADRAADLQATPAFTWAADEAAAYYRFTLATAADLTDPVDTATGITGSSYQPAVDLTPGTTYYWRVDAVNGSGESSSPVRSFTMDTLPTEPLVVDDFESYADDAALSAAYLPNAGGGTVTPSLVADGPTGSTAGMFAFDLGAPGYAGVVHEFPEPHNWWGFESIGLTLDAPVGTTVSVQFVAGGSYWESSVEVAEVGPQPVEIPFADFAPPAWAGDGRLDLSSVTQYALYVADTPVGALVVDDVVAVPPAAVDPEPTPEPSPTLEPSPEPTPTGTPVEPTGPPAPVPPGTGGGTPPGSPGDGSTGESGAGGGTTGDTPAPGATPEGSLASTGAGAVAAATLALTLTLLGLAALRRRANHLPQHDA